jgi:hypothetical protein
LVLFTTTRYKIEPFVRQLIRLMDHLRAGKTNNIAKLTRPGRDGSRAMLFAAIAKTVDEGHTMAAYHTTYQAALCAYENSSIICWLSMNTLVVCARRGDAKTEGSAG